jgi:hypothetical protein
MILVSFFFSHQALSKNLSRNGIRLKVTKFGDTNRQTNRHLSFNIKRSFLTGNVDKMSDFFEIWMTGAILPGAKLK